MRWKHCGWNYCHYFVHESIRRITLFALVIEAAVMAALGHAGVNMQITC